MLFFWSTTCPWCKLVEKFVKVLKVNGWNIIDVNIDTDSLNPYLDYSVFFANRLGYEDMRSIAPLFVVLLKQRSVERIIYVPCHRTSEEVNEEVVKKDVATMILSFILCMKSLGVNLENLLEDPTVQKLVSPVLS